MVNHEKSQRAKNRSVIPPGLAVAILLLFAFGETAGGDWSGLGPLFRATPIVLLMRLGWKRPLWGGIFLLLMGILALLRFSNAFQGPGWLAPFLIIIAPLLLSGLLLLGAAGLGALGWQKYTHVWSRLNILHHIGRSYYPRFRLVLY